MHGPRAHLPCMGCSVHEGCMTKADRPTLRATGFHTLTSGPWVVSLLFRNWVGQRFHGDRADLTGRLSTARQTAVCQMVTKSMTTCAKSSTEWASTIKKSLPSLVLTLWADATLTDQVSRVHGSTLRRVSPTSTTTCSLMRSGTGRSGMDQSSIKTDLLVS